MLARYEYDVFGAIRAETGTSDNTRKFTGKEFDADSNLYYYGARYYDPYIGRFTQRDPSREQSASAVASAFILKWQLHHGAEVIDLDFANFDRFSFNGPANDPDNPWGLLGNPFGPSVASAWGKRADRTIAGSLLWFFKPLLAHIGS